MTVHCTNCGAPARDDDKFCAQCGQRIVVAPPIEPEVPDTAASVIAEEPTSRSPFAAPIAIIVVVLALLFLAAIGRQMGGDRPAEKAASQEADAAENASNAADNAINAAMAIADLPAAPAAAGTGGSWSYSITKDEMTDGKVTVATTTSTNSIFQSAPYDGSTTMSIHVRKHPRHGTDVYLILSSGQLLCPSYEGCSAMVRFDDAPARRISMLGSSDNSSDTVFVAGAADFIAKLKKAKHVVVALNIYEAGAPNFTFDTAGLKWPPEGS